jgi:two-component system LytT family sensor kinase
MTDLTGPGTALRANWLLWVFLGWTLYAALSTFQIYTVYHLSGMRPAVSYGPVVASLATSWAWAGATPLIMKGAIRFPIEAPRTLPHLGVHLAFALTASVVEFGLGVGVLTLLRGSPPPDLLMRYVDRIDLAVFYYMSVMVIAHALVYYRQSRERAVRAATLAQEVTKARLQSLRHQLRPHFLFNSLNSISGLIQEDPEAADRMTENLSELLRRSLEQERSALVPVMDELEAARLYLKLQSARYDDWLSYHLEVDPAALGALIPPFILQPLLENAIEHGLQPAGRKGVLRVSVALSHDRLHLVVEDDGVGSPPRVEEGIGLRNSRARLTALFGADYRLELRSRKGGGSEVVLNLPHRSAAEPATI